MVTMNMKTTGCNEAGMYYPESQRIVIFVNKHESIEEIYKTMNHEIIHHCINMCGEFMDEDQEERLIFCMNWAEYYIDSI